MKGKQKAMEDVEWRETKRQWKMLNGGLNEMKT